MDSQAGAAGTYKLILAWIGVALGSITLSRLVLLATLVYTVLQIYKLLRDMRRDKRKGGE